MLASLIAGSFSIGFICLMSLQHDGERWQRTLKYAGMIFCSFVVVVSIYAWANSQKIGVEESVTTLESHEVTAVGKSSSSQYTVLLPQSDGRLGEVRYPALQTKIYHDATDKAWIEKVRVNTEWENHYDLFVLQWDEPKRDTRDEYRLHIPAGSYENIYKML